MSNPNVRNQGAHTVDFASKVEILRLKQELAAAQNSLAIPNQPPTTVSTVEEEQLVKELGIVRQENEEMKEQGAFNFWRKKCGDAKNERDEAERLTREARSAAREESELYGEEENEARRRGEDVDRLRRERNEWRECYDELIAGWTEEENTEEEHEVRSTSSEAAVSAIGHSAPKISRKEADIK